MDKTGKYIKGRSYLAIREEQSLYRCEVIENYKLLNDAVYSIVIWLGKHRMRWLATFVMGSFKKIFGEYRTFRRGKVIYEQSHPR